MSEVAGLDGCPGGWVAVVLPQVEVRFFANLAVACDELPECRVILADIPMGLDQGGRDCEKALRRLLSPRGSCVFSSPALVLLEATTYDEMRQIADANGFKRISKQCWNILPKIREAQLDDPRLAETHPEGSFCLMNGGRPVLAPKKSPEGRAIRIELLTREFGFEAVNRVLAAKAGKKEDRIDAMAAAWSARRYLTNDATILPFFPPPMNSSGRSMGIIL